MDNMDNTENTPIGGEFGQLDISDGWMHIFLAEEPKLRMTRRLAVYTRDDLLYWSSVLALEAIELCDIKSEKVNRMRRADLAVFVDDDGRLLVLKSVRLRSRGMVFDDPSALFDTEA